MDEVIVEGTKATYKITSELVPPSPPGEVYVDALVDIVAVNVATGEEPAAMLLPSAGSLRSFSSLGITAVGRCPSETCRRNCWQPNSLLAYYILFTYSKLVLRLVKSM
jgi:hypothetical protein